MGELAALVAYLTTVVIALLAAAWWDKRHPNEGEPE